MFSSKADIRYLVPLCILMLAITSHGQRNIVDSLSTKRSRIQSKLNYSETDTTYIKVLYELAKGYLYIDIDSSEALAHKALKLSKKVSYEKGLSGSYLVLGLVRNSYQEVDKSITFGQMADSIALKGNYNSLRAYILDLLGIVYFKKGDYAKSYAASRQGLLLAEKQGNHILQVNLNANIAIYFAILRDLKSSLAYFGNALSLLEKKGDPTLLARLKMNMAGVYTLKKEYEKSRKLLEEAIPTFQNHGFETWEALVYAELGNVYNHMDRPNDALGHLKRADSILEFHNDIEALASVFSGYAESHYQKETYDLSWNYAIKADSIYKNLNQVPWRIDVLDLLYKLSKEKNRVNKALNYLSEYKRLSDSLEVIDRSLMFKMLDAQTKFDQELERLKIANIRKVERQQMITYFFIILLLGLMAITILLRKNNVQR